MRFLERVSPEHADDLGLQMLQASRLLPNQADVHLGDCMAPCKSLLGLSPQGPMGLLLGDAFPERPAHLRGPCHVARSVCRGRAQHMCHMRTRWAPWDSLLL